MKTIGLTGGIASGKSTVARILTVLGYEVLDADQVARLVVEPGMPAYQRIVAEFGPTIRLPDGKLDRKALGKIVFADSALRRQLEQIIHPEVIARIKETITARRTTAQPFLFVEVPLLFETGMEKMFDLVWVVNLTTANQLQRLVERDQISSVGANQRLAAQLTLSEKAARADWVIENNGSLAELNAQVQQALKTLE